MGLPGNPGGSIYERHPRDFLVILAKARIFANVILA